LEAEAANGQYWDLRQPLPPAPQVRDAVAAGKEETSTIDEEKSKKGSWSNTTKLRTDASVPLREKLATKIWTTSWTTPGQPTSRL
jgi:hypothetical protein